MIINNVLLKLKNRDEKSLLEAKNILLGMKGKIEVLLDIQAEINIRDGSSAYDMMFITKFASMEDMNIYLTHPAHLEVAKYIVTVLETQASVCYEAG